MIKTILLLHALTFQVSCGTLNEEKDLATKEEENSQLETPVNTQLSGTTLTPANASGPSNEYQYLIAIKGKVVGSNARVELLNLVFPENGTLNGSLPKAVLNYDGLEKRPSDVHYFDLESGLRCPTAVIFQVGLERIEKKFEENPGNWKELIEEAGKEITSDVPEFSPWSSKEKKSKMYSLRGLGKFFFSYYLLIVPKLVKPSTLIPDSLVP